MRTVRRLVDRARRKALTWSGRLRGRLEARAPLDEAGSAIVEFLGVTLVLLVPTVYLVLVLGRLQAAAFAAESGAAQAARAFVIADDVAAGERAAVATVHLALEDQGFSGTDAASALTLECSTTPCREPGSTVTTRVQVDVPLPFVPDLVRDAVPLSVRVAAEHLAAVDLYAGSR